MNSNLVDPVMSMEEFGSLVSRDQYSTGCYGLSSDDKPVCVILSLTGKVVLTEGEVTQIFLCGDF